MAEEPKIKFTFVDEAGKPIEEPKAEEQEQEEQEEEEQEEAAEEEQSSEEESEEAEESSDDSEEAAEEDEEEDSSDDGSAEEEQEQEQEEDEEEDIDDDDVVDYEELPEAVQKLLDFIEETNGSVEDFVRINQDFSKLPQDQIIRDYIKQKNPQFDESDIDFEMEELFGIDEDADSERDIRKKKVARKKYYGEALKYFQGEQEKWKTELGSSAVISPEAQEAIDFKQQYEQQQQQTSKKVEASRRSFVKSTDKLLGKDFKGFEVKLGDDKVLYKPENVTKVKEQNLNVNNLLNKFLDKDGNVSDVAGYHRALAVASDPESFAQHFYELGKAAMAEEDAKDSKNIKQKPRQTQPSPKTKQPKFKFLDDGSSNKGLIKLKDY